MKLFFLTALMAVDWGDPRRRLAEGALAAASLGLGLWLGADWLIWGGVLGLALTAANPMQRLQRAFAPRRRPAPARPHTPGPRKIGKQP
jgi:hypothetical protein